MRPCGKDRRTRGRCPFSHPARRCRSSVVEHPLGKGEVVSSILTGSTRKSLVPSMFWQLPSKRLVAESCRTERDATGEIRTKSAPSVLYVYMATEPRMPHEQRVCALVKFRTRRS